MHGYGFPVFTRKDIFTNMIYLFLQVPGFMCHYTTGFISYAFMVRGPSCKYCDLLQLGGGSLQVKRPLG